MSFSTEIKKELSQLNNLSNKKEVKYELLGYFLSNNTIKQKGKIKYSTESEYNINRYTKLLRNMNIDDFSIDIQGKIYIVTFKASNLKDLNIEKEQISQIECIDYIKAVIRGIFLGSGSINNPENKYHLEMELSSEYLVQIVIEIMEKHYIKVKSINKSIYIKDGEEISKFLAFIGASKSVIRFEEIRVKRSMNNKINRLVNCKTANLNKILNASIEQIDAIKKLKESGQFQKMDESLKELAELRIEHPELPLGELGKLLKKPIGKSGVNYRLRKIIELSK